MEKTETDLLRLLGMMAKAASFRDGLNVRLSGLEQKQAQLRERIVKEPQLKKRLGPIIDKLLQDFALHEPHAKASIRGAEEIFEQLSKTPINVTNAEYTIQRYLESSAQVSKDLSRLNSSFDELLAASGYSLERGV
jgi:uncharacterized protein YjbK